MLAVSASDARDEMAEQQTLFAGLHATQPQSCIALSGDRNGSKFPTSQLYSHEERGALLFKMTQQQTSTQSPLLCLGFLPSYLLI